MELSRSRSVASSLEWLDEASSTNDVAAQRAREGDWRDLAVIATDNQVGGRGRLGRVWIAPAGRCLAASVLLRARFADGEPLPTEAMGWVPLLAGVAATRTIRAHGVERAELKWPNDVLVDGRKLCGILSELRGDAIVVGSGFNLTLEADERPVETATSLVLEGAPTPDVDAFLADYLTEFGSLWRAFLNAGADSRRSGLHSAVREECATLGRSVRVQLPSGETLTGTAADLSAGGELIVESTSGFTVIAAGDVTHLRY